MKGQEPNDGGCSCCTASQCREFGLGCRSRHQAAPGYKATRCRPDVVEGKTRDESNPVSGRHLDPAQVFQVDNDNRVDAIGEMAAMSPQTNDVSSLDRV